MTETPRNAVLLARLSDSREDIDLTDEGIPFGLDDQVQRMTEYTTGLGWRVHRVILNPRLSAYKKRKVTLADGTVDYRVWRPDLREALALLWSGEANALVCLDLDRAFRDPRDLQDLINLVEHGTHDVVVRSVTNSLRMERGRDNFDAEVRVLMANKASRDTARRVASAREKRAGVGKFGGGNRPYGFKADGLTPIPEEYERVQDWAAAILADDTGMVLKGLARKLNEDGVTKGWGGKWTAQTLRDILLRPRTAGFKVYRPVASHRSGPYTELDIIGAAPWEPILPEDTWRAVVARITDPARVTTPGPAQRWLGSGLYLCVCGERVKSATGPTYRCPIVGGGHVKRRAVPVDKLVIKKLLNRLSRSDAAELLPSRRPDVDTNALRADIKTWKRLLNDYVSGQINNQFTLDQVRTATAALVPKIEQAEATLRDNAGNSPLAGLINAADVPAAWEKLPLVARRQVVSEVLTVTILPVERLSGPRFNPHAVRIEPVRRGAR
jgi:site-specific DNA recombinase